MENIIAKDLPRGPIDVSELLENFEQVNQQTYYMGSGGGSSSSGGNAHHPNPYGGSTKCCATGTCS